LRASDGGSTGEAFGASFVELSGADVSTASVHSIVLIHRRGTRMRVEVAAPVDVTALIRALASS